MSFRSSEKPVQVTTEVAGFEVAWEESFIGMNLGWATRSAASLSLLEDHYVHSFLDPRNLGEAFVRGTL